MCRRSTTKVLLERFSSDSNHFSIFLGNQIWLLFHFFDFSSPVVRRLHAQRKQSRPQLVGIAAWRKAIRCGGNRDCPISVKSRSEWMVRQEKKVQCKPLALPMMVTNALEKRHSQRCDDGLQVVTCLKTLVPCAKSSKTRYICK